jgi:hypothetical protein
MNVLMESNAGKLAVKLSRDFTKLVAGVVDTNKKGKMIIEIELAPSKSDDGGIQMVVRCEAKLKVPEFGIAPALFFVDGDNELVRTDPRQSALFGEESTTQEAHRV